MPMLKASIISRIHSRLETNEHFCLDDFSIHTPDNSNSGTLLRIVFLPRPEYNYTLKEVAPRKPTVRDKLALDMRTIENTLFTHESPGDIKTKDVNSHENIDSVLSRLYYWLENIREDLTSRKSSLSIPEEPDDIIETLYKHVNEDLAEPDSYFDAKEIENLEDKLDKLQIRVDELETQFSIPKQQTEEIHEVITKSKSDLSVYAKGIWFKTSGTKVLRTLRGFLTTTEGKVVLTEIVKKLLS
jgi:hypothetical protein